MEHFIFPGQRFRGIRHMVAHTLMRHPARVKTMSALLQKLDLEVENAEHRRHLWEREAAKMPPKKTTTERRNPGTRR